MIKITPEIEQEVSRFNTSEELLRSGGISIAALDRAAFGFFYDDIKTLMPNQLHIKWRDDYSNVLWEVQKSGLSKKAWAEKINLSEPIDVAYEKNKFYIEDGHHRYYAAKVLNKPLNVNLEIKMNPIKALAPKLSYDDFHREVFNQIKGNVMNEINTINDNYIYHGTGKGQALNIQRDGFMKPNNTGEEHPSISFTNKLDYAIYYAKSKGGTDKMCVLRTPLSDKFKLSQRIRDNKGYEYITFNKVPVSELEVLTKNNWQPLLSWNVIFDEPYDTKSNINKNHIQEVISKEFNSIKSKEFNSIKLNKIISEEYQKLLQEASFYSFNNDDILTDAYLKEFIRREDSVDDMLDYYIQDNDLDEINTNEIRKTDDFKEYIKDWLERDLDIAKENISDNINYDSNKITIYRAMTVDDNWIHHLKAQGKRLGIYWSWDIKSADAHWGNFNQKNLAVITADIDENYVNWIETFELNMHPSLGDEREIRLFKNTPINVKSITINDEEINLNQFNGKIFYA